MQYLLLVNEGRAAVLVPQPSADSKQKQTGSSGEFVSVNLWFDTTHTLIQTLTAGNRERPRIYKTYIPFIKVKKVNGLFSVSHIYFNSMRI